MMAVGNDGHSNETPLLCHGDGCLMIDRTDGSRTLASAIIGAALFCLAAHSLSGEEPPPTPAVAAMFETAEKLAADRVNPAPETIGEAGRPGRILVRFDADVPAEQRLSLQKQSEQLRTVAEVRSVPGLTILESADVDKSLATFRAHPGVLYAESDGPIHIFDLPNDPQFDRLWGLRNTGQSMSGFFCFATGTVGADIRAVEAWDVWTGDPDFRIAVIDTGINYSHPDLAANVWTNGGEIAGNGVDDDGNGWIDDVHGYDFINDDADPMDDHRHGSHVAGTIGAVGNNGLGVAGVNHRCSLVALKVFDANGRGEISGAVEAMDYVIANGIRLSNNSWGCSSEDEACYSRALFDVIEASQAVGHVFIAAAGNDFGNDNDEVPFFPVGFELANVIGVAALHNRDAVAAFSNIGSATVELAAPGTCIYSTMLSESYGFLDGTSMAAPHVTGVAALVMSRLPDLDWPQIRTRLLETVRRTPSLGGVVTTGGVIDAAAAVWDCNGNGVADDEDLTAGTSDDCNSNALPDECESDCNGNGVADSCDIDSAFSLDCSRNGIPDECEPDCNANGVPDSCDIADGSSDDCAGEGNGVPDECETDCDSNEIADSCDIQRGAEDCNFDNVPDHCQPGGLADCNSNGRADLCDLFYSISRDCNDNHVPDECDIASGFSDDCSNNRVPDECEPDCNDTGLADSCDIVFGATTDCNNNRIPDECEPDCNSNEIADACDITAGTSNDCNENRVPDECELGGTLKEDCNNNGQPDLCDIFDGLAKDCNSNAILDACDIATGFSTDATGDGVPDECEGKGFRVVPIDASGKHTIDGRDILLSEGGQRVTLELRLSGWDLDGDGAPRLRGYQSEVDIGHDDGFFGELALSRLPCTSDDDCPGWQSHCGTAGLCDAFGAFFVDSTHPNYVYLDLVSLWVANLTSRAPNILMLNALLSAGDSLVDPGVERYGATLRLDVPEVVGGTFHVDVRPGGSIQGSVAGTEITIPSFSGTRIIIPPDCNRNGILDGLEIEGGSSQDCNGNGVLDECLHIEPDCNDNAVPDDCDIAESVSEDCTADGVPDECEPDCNVNGYADSCDIFAGVSSDANRNGVPDECEIHEFAYVDEVNCFFPGSGTQGDPYCSLQFAIDNAPNGRSSILEIVVADGVYRGAGNSLLNFEGRALTVRSANGPDHCVIDCAGQGPAVFFRGDDDDVRFAGFTITNCFASAGAAMFINGSDPIIDRCVFTDNHALRFGGALYIARGNPIVRNCRIIANRAELFYGGGIYVVLGQPTIANTLIADNDAVQGGGVYVTSGSAVIRNSTLADNVAQSLGNSLYVVGLSSRVNIDNSILWGGDFGAPQEIYVGGGAQLAVRYSDIAGGSEGVSVVGAHLDWAEGNIDSFPSFVNPSGQDYHLSAMSPCINLGDPSFDAMADESSDLDGEPRVSFSRVDMGVDEAIDFADCDGDGLPDGHAILSGSTADCNGNAILDTCDLDTGASLDELPPQGDGIPDECQSDCNINFIPDEIDLLAGTSKDCNENGIPDECDIVGGDSQDCDLDGIPNECDLFGDVRRDGTVNLFDLFCVLNAFSDVFATCTLEEADIGQCNPNGKIDLFDVFAVLEALAGNDLCCPDS